MGLERRLSVRGPAAKTRISLCSYVLPVVQTRAVEEPSYSAKAEYPVIIAVNEVHRSRILDHPVKPDDDGGD
jgi:hypothetical protein